MIDEIPRLFVARRGFSVSYKGKTLLSTVDPVGLADRIAGAIPKPRGTLYFCPSPLFGYGLKLLLEGISSDSAVLCVETDEKLMALSEEHSGETLRDNPRFRLVRTGDPAFLCAFVREAWRARAFRRLEVLHLTGGWQLNPELYDSLADALRREIALDWGNAMTLVKLGRRYARNALRNLALLPRSSPLSAVNFGAAPVLVLGAGPSLDGVLKGLRTAFGELPENPRPFRIMCVDTGLSSLYEWNLRPDLVVALESQHWNLRDFIGLASWEVPVAMDLSALPATAGLLGARPHLFFTPWTRLSLFGRLKTAGLLPETLPPLGSVGLSAVAIARRLSTGPVILGGIDFSFSLDQTHTRSAPAHLERLRRQTRFQGLIDGGAAFRKGCFTVPSKTGESVRSNQAMKNYRELFQREFATSRRIRDIAGSGLPLGLRTLTAEEAYAVLAAGAAAGGARNTGERTTPHTTALVRAFVRRELESLTGLRGILTGEITAGTEQLEGFLDTCDYLWAHFPDYAGAEGKHPVLGDLGFLKRVRAEIDPFINLLQGVLKELA
jgi:hypothetical protein